MSCGDGLSCAYRDTISWQGPTSPLPMQNNPQVVFERLFGDGSTDAERRARRQQSVSLLDSVRGEASALQRRLPAIDRNRVDQYLNDVREIERRIEKAAKQASTDLTLPDAPTGDSEGCRRAHQADVRPAGARLAGRHHPRDDAAAGQGAQQRGLREERRAGCVPHPVAPLEHPREPGSVCRAQPLPRRPARRICSTSCRRRRTATARCWIIR